MAERDVQQFPPDASDEEVAHVVGILLARAPVKAAAVGFDAEHELGAGDVQSKVSAVDGDLMLQLDRWHPWQGDELGHDACQSLVGVASGPARVVAVARSRTGG